MRTRLIGGLLASVLVLAACSDDDDDNASTDSTKSDGETTEEEAPALTGLDASFGTAGVLAAPLSPTAHDRFLGVTNGPAGSFYAVGWTSPGGDNAMVLAKLGNDGKPDPTFGTGGVATVNVAVGGKVAEVARGVAVQPDGKIVISGPVDKDPKTTSAGDPDTDVALVRFDATGALDPTFGKGGTAILNLGNGRALPDKSFISDNAWGLVALADGRLVLWGSTPAAGHDDSDYALVGVTSAGALDPAFGTKGVTKVDLNHSGDSPRNMIVQPDGKIVATGYSHDAAGVVSPVIVRATPDGKLDAAFGAAGVATAPVLPGGVAESYNVGLQGDNYVLTGYGHGPDPNEKVDMVSMRFKADGNWDQTYGTAGLTRIDIATDADRGRNLAVLPDGRILVVGVGSPALDTADTMIVLLDENGLPVADFGTAGHLLSDLGGPTDAWFDVVVAEGGKSVMVVGYKGADPKATDGSNDDAAAARLKL